jgi:hypothetical protein
METPNTPAPKKGLSGLAIAGLGCGIDGTDQSARSPGTCFDHDRCTLVRINPSMQEACPDLVEGTDYDRRKSPWDGNAV